MTATPTTTVPTTTTVPSTVTRSPGTAVPDVRAGRGIRRRLVSVALVTAIGAGAFVTTTLVLGGDGPEAGATVVAEPATVRDLQIAASWARYLDIVAPQGPEVSPRRATERDLLLAAHWVPVRAAAYEASQAAATTGSTTAGPAAPVQEGGAG